MIFFHPIDPFAFPNLGTTMVNLFRAATLEDWTDIMYTSWYGCRDVGVCSGQARGGPRAVRRNGRGGHSAGLDVSIR